MEKVVGAGAKKAINTIFILALLKDPVLQRTLEEDDYTHC